MTITALNDAISEAHNALEEVDNYDLHSDDAKSLAEFEALTKAHEEAVAKVIAITKDIASESGAV